MTIRRTALIAWDYPPSASGLAVAAREIAESLVEAGVDVSVYTLDRSDESSLDGVRIIGCRPDRPGLDGSLRKRMALGHLVAPRWFDQKIRADHAARPYDCLEATNWYAPGVFASRIATLPFVTRHSTPAALTGAGSGSLRNRIDGRFAQRLEASTARRSDGHIFNTKDHGETVKALYGLDGVVPSAVVGLSLPPERLSAAKAASYPLPDEPIGLLFVGRPERRKGFDCLMDAVERLATEARSGTLPRFQLRLVGVAPTDLTMLSDKARPFVAPLGKQSEAELDALYGSAHIMVAPSRYESFGLVYQEALAYGRPLVALRVDASARQALGTSGAGQLASAATGEALANAIRPLILDDGLRMQMRDAALATSSMYTRAALARNSIDLYSGVYQHQGGKFLKD